MENETTEIRDGWKIQIISWLGIALVVGGSFAPTWKPMMAGLLLFAISFMLAVLKGAAEAIKGQQKKQGAEKAENRPIV